MNKKKGSNYDEDYSKIKPGYANKRTPNAENYEGGFVDVIASDKKERRDKALDAQAIYKQELDAQIHAKRVTKNRDDESQYSKIGSHGVGLPLGELKQSGGSPRRNVTYQDDDGQYSPSKGGYGGKVNHKEKNLTEAERDRLEDQKRKKAEMKDMLDQQVIDKQRQKELAKLQDDDHARKILLDQDRSRQDDMRMKQSQKDSKASYAGELQRQIVTNQTHKKTSLW
jgi:hypothetical protein